MFILPGTEICAPVNITFVNTSSGGVSYTWYIDGLQEQWSATPDDLVKYFDNTSTGKTQYDISLVVDDGAGNTDSINRPVWILPRVNAAFSADQTEGCQPLDLQFTNSSSGNTGSYEWNFGDGGSSGEMHPVHTFYNTTDIDDIIFEVSLVATSPFFCRDTARMDITVSPMIEAIFTVSQAEGCHELNFEITDLSTGTDDAYWEMGDGTSYVNPGAVFNHLYTNDTPDPQTYLVRLRVENEEGCFDVTEKEVVVWPGVTAAYTAITETGCSPLTVDFSNSSSGAVSWLWEFGDGGTSSLRDPVHAYEKNMGSAEEVYSVRLIAYSQWNCTDTSDYSDITVLPHAEADFTIGPAVGCHPLTVTIENHSYGAHTWLWDFGDGTTLSSGDASFSRTFENTTGIVQVYTVRLTVENDYCTHFTEQQVTVYPAVTAAFSITDVEGCSPLGTGFLNLSSGATEYLWEFGDGGTSAQDEPLHTYEKNLSGSDTVYSARLIAISEFLCRDTADYQNITVYPHIEALFSIDSQEGCHPHTVTVINQSTGADTYTWDMGDGTIYPFSSDTFTHTYNNSGTDPEDLVITLTVLNGRNCSDSYQQQVTTLPQLTASFGADVTIGCEPLTISFTNASENADYYLWDFGNGATSVLEHPQHTFFNPGTIDTLYRVTLTGYSGGGECVSTDFTDIVVHGRVTADFTFGGSPGCNPLEIEFINTSTGGGTFFWDFGNGNDTVTFNTDPFVYRFENTDFSSTAEYTVILEVTSPDGCVSVKERTVEVWPDISAYFEADTGQGCHQLTVDFTDLSSGAFHYHWDFGDGNTSSQANPLHTFSNTGGADSIYRVSLVVTAENNVCRDSFFMDVLVHPYIDAEFSFRDSPSCTPFEVLFENSSINASEYHWDFGNGNDTVTYNRNPFIHRFENSEFLSEAEYTVTMRAVSAAGCESQVSRTVRVWPDVSAYFEPDKDLGCHPLTVDFRNLSNGALHYAWNFGDGSSSSEVSPVHTFTNTGSADTVYRVKLFALAGNNVCADSFFVNIRVHPLVKADFSFQESVLCSPAEFVFSNSSAGGVTYRWDFGDGNDTVTYGSDSFIHAFINSDPFNEAEFRVRLEAESLAGCTDVIERTVRVHPRVAAVVNPSVTEGCHPLRVDFENFSPGGYTWEWDFGDGATTDKESPVHTFTNFTDNTITREVSMMVTSREFCTSDTNFTITIHPLPKPFVNIEQSIACPPFDLLIENDTRGAEIFTWHFGDGNSLVTGSEEPFSHTYHNSGSEIANYDLKLIAESEFGCIDSAQQKIFVYPGVITSFSSVTEGCSPLIVRFNDSSVRAVEHHWDLGDGHFSRLKDPTHQYFNNSVNDTSYYVRQVGISQYGCTDTAGYFIEVWPQPVSEFSAFPTHQVYPSATIELENMTNAGYWDFEWYFDDGRYSNSRDPGNHTYGTWGEYNITLSAWSDNCRHEVSHRVRIFAPPPVASFEATENGCSPLGVQFTNHSVYGEGYLWEFGDGSTSVEQNPYHVYENAGIFNVKLTVFAEGGEDYAYREVEVFNLPVVEFAVSPQLVMLPEQSVQLFNMTENATRYLWDFGDGNSSSSESPLHLYMVEGEYDITLMAWTDRECFGELVKYNAVVVRGEGLMIFPNAFRVDPSGPSGGRYDRDAINPNTVFYPLHAGVAEYRLEIYNRWGEHLFTSNDVDIGWDGYYRGGICKQDVYVWKVWGTYVNGEKFIKAGDVTLLR